jgi:subtilisin family serine protease
MFFHLPSWRTRLLLVVVVVVLCIIPGTTGAGKLLGQGNPGGLDRAIFVPNQVLIQFNAEASDEQIAQVLNRGLLRVLEHVQTGPMRDKGEHGLTVAFTGLPVEQAIERLSKHPAVDFVEPNWVYSTQVSNDPGYTDGKLWGMYGDITSPINEYGSKAGQAWAAGATGSSKVYIGIIDTGVDVGHPDLKQNAWKNPFDPVDGVDRDRNGYVDDRHGWNFYSNNRHVYESATEDRHGTHVAGTIAAKGGNGIGVAGINWHVTFITAKFLGSGGGSTSHAVRAVDYMTDLKKRHGLNIVAINASWGGGGYSRALHDALLRAAKAGILFVAAAGNNGSDNDKTIFYPASYDTRQGTKTETAAGFNSVISVAAIDKSGKKASFSNYGAKTVHLGAPGVGIYSTNPLERYANSSGTSMAAPHVTGAVALYASLVPKASASEIRNAILRAAIPTPALKGITETGGRLDIAGLISSVKPTVVSDPIVVTVPTGLAAPSGVTAKVGLSRVVGKATVLVNWDPTTGAEGYNLHRKISPNKAWREIVSNTPYTTASMSINADGSRYDYKVSALNSHEESEDSAEVWVRPRPPMPANLKASPVSSQTIDLTWADRTSDETGFRIEMSRNGTDWSEIGTVESDVRRYSATGLLRNRTYWFRVQAFNNRHMTDWSNVVSATTP